MIQNKENKDQLIEKLIEVQRNSRTIAGGRIMSFSALVVVGDGEGKVGFGRGKALEVSVAIKKATNEAKNSMASISFNFKRKTIWYETNVEYGATKIYMKPASEGTGIVASNTINAICSAAGINNIICKIHGSSTRAVIVRAFIEELRNMKPAHYFARKRGLTLEEMYKVIR